MRQRGRQELTEARQRQSAMEVFAEKNKTGIDGGVITVYTDTENKTSVGGIEMSEALNRARNKYDAANTIHFHLKFNKNTDIDILTKLSHVANKQGYIKELIRKDLRITEK